MYEAESAERRLRLLPIKNPVTKKRNAKLPTHLHSLDVQQPQTQFLPKPQQS
jgi:hypothetical protein